ncbi:hypothetical protein [Streptomyces sp. MST-110588]|uniref:hypothetical protein n=1 Tax=Streptomyces sp. MST-110588 TaxID=2833628 RepID=UPI001F5C7991|nr:hypothetical protein [Streptomyces sp. MST-110588]UNO43561.1 hypothetical protein KGS77_33900 [Streptomyces sp. MST-110588]
MKRSIAGVRGQRVAGTGAAALLVALGTVVTAGGTAPVAAAEGRQQATGARLVAQHLMNTYYIPQYRASAPDERPTEYQISLRAAGRAADGRTLPVKKVKVTLDLAVFKGKARVEWENKGYGCTRSGTLMTCELGDIASGALFTPFRLKPGPGAVPGPAGNMNVTVTSANAPTLRHTTRVVMGAPVLTARQDKPLTGVKPGSAMEVRPAFGNKGDTAIEDSFTVVVTTEEATLRRQYSNCRYDKAVAPTKAQCELPGPLPAGAAYETDGPVTAVADRTAMYGKVHYTVLRAHDTLGNTLLPASAPRGTGGPLGLRPVDGSGADFEPSAYWKAEMSGGGLSFSTNQINDVQAIGFTIKGKIGQVVEAQVPYPRNFQEGLLRLKLPQGVSLVPVKLGDHPSELSYCWYVKQGQGLAQCAARPDGSSWLRARIDKRVPGARGSISVTSDPKTDPDQKNNTAPVTVEYLK